MSVLNAEQLGWGWGEGVPVLSMGGGWLDLIVKEGRFSSLSLLKENEALDFPVIFTT